MQVVGKFAGERASLRKVQDGRKWGKRGRDIDINQSINRPAHLPAVALVAAASSQCHAMRGKPR